MRRLIVALVALLSLSGTAFAGSAIGVTITGVEVVGGGTGMFFAYLSSSISSVPACGAANPTRIAIKGSTPEGSIVVAGVLTAYATGKRIDYYGTGACSDWSDTESIWVVISH